MADFREDKVVKEILSDSGVTAIIASRVFPLMMQPKENFPCVVYRLANGVPIASADGESQEAEYSVEIICLYRQVGNNVHEVSRSLFNAVKTAFGRYTGVIDSSISVDATYLEGERDEIYDSDLRAFGRVLTYKLMHRKV